MTSEHHRFHNYANDNLYATFKSLCVFKMKRSGTNEDKNPRRSQIFSMLVSSKLYIENNFASAIERVQPHRLFQENLQIISTLSLHTETK